MKSKEDLFHLIKAMSKSEKRYFTLDAQKTGKKGSKYLDLFQLINAMSEYDESKLKKKFPRNLPSDKAYLYEAILRSMRDYRSAKSKVAQIKEMILDSNYLYERGLYSQCEERLKDAKDLALQMDEQLELLEINKLERILVWNKKEAGFENKLDLLDHEKQSSIHAIDEEFNYLDIYDQLSKQVIKNPDLDDPALKEKFNQDFAALADRQEQLPQTPQALRKYYQCLALFYQLQGNYDKVFEYYSLVVQWWDQNKKLKAEEFFRYVVDISNLLFICLRLKKYGDFPQLIELIEKDTPSNQHDQKVVFKRLSLYKVVYYINSGETQGTKELIEEIEKGLQKYDIGIANELSLIGNVALLLFIRGDYQGAQEWSRKIVKGKESKFRSDIQIGMHLIFLIATFELDVVDDIDHSLRLVKRNFNQRYRSKIGPFELLITNAIKKLNKSNLSDRKQQFSSLKDAILEIKENPNVKISFGLDELFIHWIDSKLQKKSIIETY